MARSFIREHFRVRLSQVSVGRLLRTLRLSPQQPLARPHQRDPQLVELWMTQKYPEIRAEAKRFGARISFAEEASVRSDYQSGTTWASVGKTPVVDATGARFKLNILSVPSPRDELRFMVIEQELTACLFIEFLQRLLHKRHVPIFLIVDGHPVRRSVAVKHFLAGTEGQMRLFRLPPYVREVNPDEQVWNHVKHRKAGTPAIHGPEQFKRRLIGFLHALKKTPALMRALFHHPHVRYAAV